LPWIFPDFSSKRFEILQQLPSLVFAELASVFVEGVGIARDFLAILIDDTISVRALGVGLEADLVGVDLTVADAEALGTL
jgi:hypothetical protein